MSILHVVARLFEKLIFDQLYTYINKNNLLYWGQSAYEKLHSTATCLIRNTDKRYRGKDNSSGTVFIYLKKAFDTVDHAILCHKIEPYDLQLNELLWLTLIFSILSSFVDLEALNLTLAASRLVFHKVLA